MTTPTFKRIVSGASKGEVLVPLIQNALYKPDFKGFNVKVEGFVEREPDGWFHPSVHPQWNEMMLYVYATEYHRMRRDPFDPSSTIAVTAGHFFHTFVQTVGVREGFLERQPEVCGCGFKHPERAEVYLVDEATKTRGHSDGVTFEGDGFEFKTMGNKVWGVPQGAVDSPEVLAWFRERCPGYYAQAQEYLRLSGRAKMVVVIMHLVHPFPMREIHVPRDEGYIRATANKYRNVLQAVADRRPPRCVCGPFSKEGKACPVQMFCLDGEDERPYY